MTGNVYDLLCLLYDAARPIDSSAKSPVLFPTKLTINLLAGVTNALIPFRGTVALIMSPESEVWQVIESDS